MQESTSRKRPWLAALLSILATGLGHLYLRRWRRAAGWLLLVYGVSVLFVDPAAVEALVNGSAVDPVALAPVLLVGGVSVIDAYFVARAQNAVARASAATATAEGEHVKCPSCGNELDPDLEFCHWCSTQLDRDSAPASAESSSRNES